MTNLSALIGSGPPSPPDTTDMTSLLGHVRREGEKLLRKAIPAQVTAVASGNRVDVQPGFKALYNSSTEALTLPIVPSVPVCQPQGQGYAIRLPVAVGDNGLLIIADRALDTWLAGTGAPADPGDPRLHDLTDAIFIPGILTDASATAAGTSTDLVMNNGVATLSIQKAGTYKIANAANELVALIQQLALALDSIVAAVGSISGQTAAGPVTFTASDPTTGLPIPIKGVVQQISSVAAKIATFRGT